MTDSSALDPYIAMRLAQSAIEADTSKNWIPTKREAPYPHIAMGHSMLLVCIGVCGAIDKQLFTFLEVTENKRSFTSDKVEFSQNICLKKSKTTRKARSLRTSKNSVHHKVKSFNENFCKKQFHQKFYKTLGPEENQKSWWSQCIKINLH